MSFCFHLPFSHPALTSLESFGFGVGPGFCFGHKKGALRRLGTPGGGVKEVEMGSIGGIQRDLMDPINLS